MKWLEKQWSFGDYSHLYESNLERLAAAADRLNLLCDSMSEEQLKYKPDGKWSINEHVGHLLTMESLWIARLDDFVIGNEILRAWNGTNADTDAGEFNRQRFGKIIEDFREIRSIQVKMLKRYSDKKDQFQAITPRLKTKISLADHVHFMAEHDQHHIQTVRTIISTFR